MLSCRTMKAQRLHRYGPPDVLAFEDAAEPRLRPDDLLVRVHAAGINPIDWKIRSGHLRFLLWRSLPMILGLDFSGVVEAVGSEVSGFKPGDEVFGCADARREGSYAELLAVKASLAALKPASLDHARAASVPLAAMTAWQALFDAGGLEAGGRALIHAAAGGVGHFAVQLARWKGAHAIGTASARNAEFVRSLGAEQVVDYNARPFEEVVEPVDMVLGAMAGDVERRSWRLLKPGGTLVSILDPFARLKGLVRLKRGRAVLLRSSGELLGRLGRLIDDGLLAPTVERVFPLSEAAEAHALIEKGHVRGKLVLTVRS